MGSCRSCLSNAVDRWNSFQVELQGAYSIGRLHELHQYEADHPSRLRALVVAVLVPLPCLLLMVATDSIPLGAPSDGFEHQRIGFFVRGILLPAIPTFGVLWLFSQLVPALVISTRWLTSVATLISLPVLMISYCWTRLIGFPVPFLIPIQSCPLVAIVGVVMWVAWKDTVRADTVVRDSVKRRVFVLAMQVAMLQIYFIYSVVFKQLPSNAQGYFTLLLPVIKLVFKNLINNRLDDMTDLAPVFIVANVDIFHTLFVSLTMQSGASRGTAVLIMIVDTVQNTIALFEISVVMARVQQAAERAAELAYGQVPVSHKTIKQELRMDLKPGVKRMVIHVLASNPRVGSMSELATESAMARVKMSSRRAPSAVTPSLNVAKPSLTTIAVSYQLERDAAQVELTQHTLKLLYMTEFYALNEFVEVVMASFYAAYLFAISLLPNRIYYTGLQGLTSTDIQANALAIAEYAGLELVSLLVFCILVQCRMKGPSAMNQLAFALEKHMKLILGPFIIWVFILLNITLEHYGGSWRDGASPDDSEPHTVLVLRGYVIGTDPTFKFEWLKANRLPHA